jgi:Zn-dependent protease with chaperone function
VISVQLIAPLVVAALVAWAATTAHRRLRPMIAAPLLTATIAAVSFAVAPATLVIAFGYLAHQPLFDGTLAWCRDALGLHAAIPTWLGLPAFAVVMLAVIRTRSVVGSWRRYRRIDPAVPEVVESDALFAYTLPGPGGQIVLSSGLVGELAPEELAVVLAHERAHGLHRHDRYVLLADLANAVVPFVRPLQRRLVFVLERWADETAVATIGGDRPMVARTLARVALSHAAVPAPAVAFGGLGVAARVDALLDPPSVSGARLWVTVMVAGIAAVAVAGAVQVHHVFPLLVALCPG